jgi:hypothetical protein
MNIIAIKVIFIISFIFNSLPALAAFNCSDQRYTLSLDDSTPGVPPKIKLTPSLILGNGTAVDTYQMKLTYPNWREPSKDFVKYTQPGAFTGFVTSVEGDGPQTIELLCTNTTNRGYENNTYTSISNTVTWEGKVDYFLASLKEGDIVREYPYREALLDLDEKDIFIFKNGKLHQIILETQQQKDFYFEHLNKSIRAPLRILSQIAKGSTINEVAGYPTISNNNSSLSPDQDKEKESNTQSDSTVAICSPKLKEDIDAKYKEAFKALDLMYKQKESNNDCNKL